jgi:hypothetical protein
MPGTSSLDALIQSFVLTGMIRPTGLGLARRAIGQAEPAYAAQRTSTVFMRIPLLRTICSPSIGQLAKQTLAQRHIRGVDMPDLVERGGGEGRRGAWTSSTTTGLVERRSRTSRSAGKIPNMWGTYARILR